MDKNCGIYKITNLINGKVYIGISIRLKDRKRGHFWALKNKKHKNPYLQSAYNKYSKENFKWEILQLCDEVNLIIREKFWINYHNALDRKFGYNILEPERHNVPKEVRDKISKSNTGKIMSKEWCKNISKSKKGKAPCRPNYKHTQETKNKIGDGNRGKVHSEEQNKKMSEINKGKHLSIETRIKQSKALTGRKQTAEHIENARASKIRNNIKKQLSTWTRI